MILRGVRSGLDCSFLIGGWGADLVVYTFFNIANYHPSSTHSKFIMLENFKNVCSVAW